MSVVEVVEMMVPVELDVRMLVGLQLAARVTIDPAGELEVVGLKLASDPVLIEDGPEVCEEIATMHAPALAAAVHAALDHDLGEEIAVHRHELVP